jgi:integrase
MSRRKSVPTYRLHKQSGQAIVTLTDDVGRRRDVLLGRYDSEESRAEYRRVLAEWEAAGRRFRTAEPSAHLSVNELILAYFRHVEQHYRRQDGTPTSEVREYRCSLRYVKELYGATPAVSFGPLALKAVRQAMIEDDLSRGVVNQRIGRVRRMFKWGSENELTPAHVHHALRDVRGLQRGRSVARETQPVGPVSVAVVNGTLPYLNRQVRAMVQVQLLTGCRPGEVCIVRACDIDMSGRIWLYRPGRHKTEHHGHVRTIAIGPRAQEIIKPFLKLDTEGYLFSPKDAMCEQREARHRARKTPLPRVVPVRRRRPMRQPGDFYSTSSYEHAIRRGVELANTAAACDLCKPRKSEERCDACKASALPHWHPHKLRHTRATELRREYGLDVARAVLGHRTPTITEMYAELDISRAAEAMERLG